MSKKGSRYQSRARDKPQERSITPTVGWFLSQDAKDVLTVPGYTRLCDNPEVKMAVDWIADRVSSMTIRMMENGKSGDIRIKDELSRKIDIEPNRLMTRKTFISAIVRTMLLEGDGNQITIPITNGGYLDELRPAPPSRVNFTDTADGGYYITVNGTPYQPDEVLHFVCHPDTERPYIGTGYRVALKDVTSNLRQAAATRKGFMSDKWKPSVIIRVADYPDMTPEGRTKILEDFLGPTQAGEPWIVPTSLMDVQTIKPLSLTDLAINESVTLDKKTVAGIFGVPLYAVGAGPFNRDEHNNAIRNVVMHNAQIIEQEMTRKILISPKRYVSLNPRSLYAYELKDLAAVGDTLAAHGLMTGNEVRNWIGMSPLEELDELKILENFIPMDMVGDQKKLKGGGGDAGGNED